MVCGGFYRYAAPTALGGMRSGFRKSFLPVRGMKLAAVCGPAATTARAIRSGTVRTPKRIASATAQATPDSPEGRWKLAGGRRPRILRRSEMRPGRGEGNPRHGSGTLPGCVAEVAGFRGYRCAQPPANIHQPCRADEAWCLRAAFLRPAATRSADAQARRAGIFVETPSIWPQAPYGAKWFPGIAA